MEDVSDRSRTKCKSPTTLSPTVTETRISAECVREEPLNRQLSAVNDNMHFFIQKDPEDNHPNRT